MITTVVLDIGNVIASFYSDIYVAQFIHRKGEIDYFNNICFRSREWVAGDYGTMTRAEIIDAICKKYPEDAEKVREIMENCDDMLRPSRKNTAVVRRLTEAGIEVYFLSNTNEHAFEYMEKSFEIFKYMKGGIASYRDGVIKPGREIFELFLKRFGKHAEECVFVDDSPNNTESARNIGYSTVTLKNMDDLEEELSKFPDLHKILNNGI